MKNDFEKKIFTIRNQRVVLDRDVAGLYGVSINTLEKAIRRNLNRLPRDFMFRLTKQEMQKLAKINGAGKLKSIAFPKYAFTVLGIAMLSLILNNRRAILISIYIMRFICSTNSAFELLKKIQR